MRQLIDDDQSAAFLQKRLQRGEQG
jgi:hypothetical protein